MFFDLPHFHEDLLLGYLSMPFSFLYIYNYIHILYNRYFICICCNSCFHIRLFYIFLPCTSLHTHFPLSFVFSVVIYYITRKSFTTWNTWVFPSFSHRKPKNVQRTQKNDPCLTFRVCFSHVFR